MDFTWIKTLLDKMFWPLVSLYSLYLVFKIYQYFAGMKLVVDKHFYNQLYIKQFILIGGILAVGILLKLWGQQKLASLTMAIPAGITLVTTLLTLLIWVFLALVFILFGKQ